MNFLDTNILLNQQFNMEEPVAICQVSLLEIENIKTSAHKDQEVKAKARRVSRWIEANEDKLTILEPNTEIAEKKGLELTPDVTICSTAAWLAQSHDVTFFTLDLNCRFIAKHIFGLNAPKPDKEVENIYKGYKQFKGSSEEINAWLSSTPFEVNEYVILENTSTGQTSEMRYDGNGFFASLKLPNSKFIKAKNSLQRCALDMLANPDITICAILGGAGSGKSYLAMQMGLYAVKEKGNQAKVLGVRNPQGEGKEIGFLPGDFEDKVGSFFLPLVQQLEGGEFEFNALCQRGMFESNIPFFMKGCTYTNTVMVVDEAEDLNEKEIKLVGTRVGENSRIFLVGDYKQSVIRANQENALVKMCNEFKGNPKFATVYLGEDVRSEVSKMFADLFE